MKTTIKCITSLVAAATLLAAPSSYAVERTLILVQGGDGPGTPQPDSQLELARARSFQELSIGHYSRFSNLSGLLCNNTQIMNSLRRESRDNRVVDIVFIGHGSRDQISLHRNEVMIGNPTFGFSNLRNMLVTARSLEGNPTFNFKLRMVYTSSDFGHTLSDDWLAIGAKVALGPLGVNPHTEATVKTFMDQFLNRYKRVEEAVAISNQNLSASDPSRSTIIGNRNLIFDDELQLALGERREITVSANAFNTPANLHLVAGQRYAFGASGSWRSGLFFTGPQGSSSISLLNRVRNLPTMKLLGELHSIPTGARTPIANSTLNIGARAEITAANHGFLNFFANDIPSRYSDNGGTVRVVIVRTH